MKWKLLSLVNWEEHKEKQMALGGKKGLLAVCALFLGLGKIQI